MEYASGVLFFPLSGKNIYWVLGSEEKLYKMWKVHLDGPEQLEVDNGQESKWYEGHSQEVGDEDVVAGVRHVRSQT